MVLSLFFKLIKSLPLSIVYVISDILNFLIYRVFKYRVDLVVKNLKRSNLNLKPYQINIITKKFYRYFTDLYLESIKMDSFSKSDFDNKFNVKNVELLNKFYNQGKSVVFMCSHYSGYEWCTSLPYYIKHKFSVVYTPIKNKPVNDFMYNSRSRHGL